MPVIDVCHDKTNEDVLKPPVESKLLLNPYQQKKFEETKEIPANRVPSP